MPTGPKGGKLAKVMVDILTGETEDREPTAEEQGKDPAAVALGRKGGLKGGKARAKAMTLTHYPSMLWLACLTTVRPRGILWSARTEMTRPILKLSGPSSRASGLG
jgi:hypothetical protein